jgi:hypothetical protein
VRLVGLLAGGTSGTTAGGTSGAVAGGTSGAAKWISGCVSFSYCY